MIDMVIIELWLVLLDVPSPTAEPDVYPVRSNGFAAAIVPALIALALFALIARWISSKPKRRR